MNKFKVLGASASLILASTGVMAKTSPTAKHLAGPAEEIELMQKASPESAAIISKHAMLEVNLQADKTGSYSWQKNILIDGDNPKILMFAANKNQWQMKVNGQSNTKSAEPVQLSLHSIETKFGMGKEQFPATQFEVQNLATGRYEFNLKSDHNETGYLMVSSDSPYRLKSFVSSTGQLVGDVINVNASGLIDDSQFSVVKRDFNLIQNAYMKITAPDGKVNEVNLFDDGSLFDKVASDGLFNGQFKAEQAGLYQVQVVSEGLTPKGKPFYRTAEHVIPVVNSDLMLNSKSVHGQYSAAHKIDLSFAVKTSLNDAKFRVMAEVWGMQTNGKSTESAPVAWISTMADIKEGQIKLQLDDRWLISKQAVAPFVLKNIKIEETNHYISMLDVGQLPLNLPMVAEKSLQNYTGGLNDSMLKGNKPEALKNSEKAAGGKLMLVHGYCSGDVWGPVQSQFSNYVKFADYNQNRSHDQFAQLIDTFGDNYPSFGIVGHSQGGAAALHLYSYYWSGLDNADGNRLIQSVGTPYQGTPLAGAIATLGSIFGIQCGSNSNMTISGADAWLSGIPTWARNEVNYYTTSFSTKWWRPDWCNFASDILLSDPEDGVTERSRGQVSGGINRGNKTGQCHVDGMRDMAQTRDSGRNSTMNANASR